MDSLRENSLVLLALTGGATAQHVASFVGISPQSALNLLRRLESDKTVSITAKARTAGKCKHKLVWSLTNQGSQYFGLSKARGTSSSRLRKALMYSDFIVAGNKKRFPISFRARRQLFETGGGLWIFSPKGAVPGKSDSLVSSGEKISLTSAITTVSSVLSLTQADYDLNPAEYQLQFLVPENLRWEVELARGENKGQTALSIETPSNLRSLPKTKEEWSEELLSLDSNSSDLRARIEKTIETFSKSTETRLPLLESESNPSSSIAEIVYQSSWEVVHGT